MYTQVVLILSVQPGVLTRQAANGTDYAGLRYPSPWARLGDPGVDLALKIVRSPVDGCEPSGLR